MFHLSLFSFFFFFFRFFSRHRKEILVDEYFFQWLCWRDPATVVSSDAPRKLKAITPEMPGFA